MNTSNDPERLVDHLYGDNSATPVPDPQGQAELDGLCTVRRTLGTWRDEPLPPALHDQVMDRVQELALRGRRTFAGFVWWLLRREVSPAVMGTTVAALILLLHSSGDGTTVVGTGHRTALLCGLVWGGIFSSVFRAALSQRTQALAAWWTRGRTVVLDMKSVCSWALLAFALAFTVAVFTPNPSPFEDRGAFLHLADQIPYAVAYGLPALYVLVGTLVAGTACGLFHRRSAVAHGTGVGLVAAVLMILDLWTCKILQPEIPWDVFAVWIGSVILTGALAGAAAGRLSLWFVGTPRLA